MTRRFEFRPVVFVRGGVVEIEEPTAPREEPSVKDLLTEAQMFRPGVYRHWKGPLYRALFLAQDSTNRPPPSGSLDPAHETSTREPMVVYVSLGGECAGNVCVRSLEQWNETVKVPSICATRELSSRTCELGTNSCIVHHVAQRFTWVHE